MLKIPASDWGPVSTYVGWADREAWEDLKTTVKKGMDAKKYGRMERWMDGWMHEG